MITLPLNLALGQKTRDLVIILNSRKNNFHPAHLNRGNAEHPERTENRTRCCEGDLSCLLNRSNNFLNLETLIVKNPDSIALDLLGSDIKIIKNV